VVRDSDRIFGRFDRDFNKRGVGIVGVLDQFEECCGVVPDALAPELKDCSGVDAEILHRRGLALGFCECLHHHEWDYAPTRAYLKRNAGRPPKVPIKTSMALTPQCPGPHLETAPASTVAAGPPFRPASDAARSLFSSAGVTGWVRALGLRQG